MAASRSIARGSKCVHLSDVRAACGNLPEASADSSVKVLVLTGTDETAFAAGTDISEFRKFSTAQDALDYEVRINGLLAALERISIPTIAAIAGACTGGGSTIAACCDIRIGASNARFGVPIARTLGNCLSMANYVRLVALLGQARVKDILFTGRLVDAARRARLDSSAKCCPITRPCRAARTNSRERWPRARP